MAAAGEAAHLTGTLQQSPSLFELLSVENFSSALRSAFEHTVKFFASQKPEVFGPLHRNFDELFLILDAVLQLQYLKTRKGTLSEAFYGLERLNINRSVNGERINILPSLLTSVLIPYTRCKAKKLYAEVREDNSTDEKQWKKLFVKIYPSILAVIGALKLYKYIRYSLGYSTSHDYILQLLGLQLGYASPNQLNPAKPMKPLKRFLITFGESVLWIIEIGSFFVQFLDTYTNKRGSIASSLPTPDFYQNTLNLDKFKCPLCNEKRKNPAALSTSGISFCYSCIVKYIRNYKKCPITSIPSNMDHIVRIFYS